MEKLWQYCLQPLTKVVTQMNVHPRVIQWTNASYKMLFIQSQYTRLSEIVTDQQIQKDRVKVFWVPKQENKVYLISHSRDTIVTSNHYLSLTATNLPQKFKRYLSSNPKILRKPWSKGTGNTMKYKNEG